MNCMGQSQSKMFLEHLPPVLPLSASHSLTLSVRKNHLSELLCYRLFGREWSKPLRQLVTHRQDSQQCRLSWRWSWLQVNVHYRRVHDGVERGRNGDERIHHV